MGSAVNPYIRQGTSAGEISLYVDARIVRTFNYDDVSQTVTPPIDSPYKGEYSDKGTADERFKVIDKESGAILIFYGVNPSIDGHLQGRLLERTNRYLESAGETGITYSYRETSDGKTVDHALTSEGRLVDYEYYTTGKDDYLKSVSVYDGSTTSDTLIAKAEYVYYDTVQQVTGSSPSSDLGEGDDLVQVKVSRMGNDGALSITRVTQYRYLDHQIKSVYEADAVQRVIGLSGGTFSSPEDLLAEDDDEDVGTINSTTVQIEDFSSRSFEHLDTAVIQPVSGTTSFGPEVLGTKYGGTIVTFTVDYYWGGSVRSETINGGCGACGTTSGAGIKKEYYHTELYDWYGGIGLDQPNQVVRIIIEDTIDSSGAASYRTVYGVNHKGMWLRKAFLTDPLNAPTDSTAWCESRILNNDWRIEEYRMPSAHKGQITTDADLKDFLNPYVPSAGNPSANDENTVNSLTGIVYHTEFDATGKRPTGKLISEGVDGDKNYLWAADYGDGDNDSEGFDNDEHQLVIRRHAYPVKTDDRNHTDRITTEYEYTFWDDSPSAGLPKDTAVKTATTIHPTISSSENGSGEETRTHRFYDQDGQLRWEKDGEGVVSYYGYHPDSGLLAYEMVDVETDDLPSDITSGSAGKWDAWSGTLPSDFNNTGDDNLQLVTRTEYDKLGRATKTIDRDGGESLIKYYADGTAVFPYVSGTSASLPVIIRKVNDGGQLESIYRYKASQVATTDTSTNVPANSANYTWLTEHQYDEISGRLTHTDRYHNIGGAAGVASAYRTTFLYDKLGRPAGIGQEVASGAVQWNVSLFDLNGRLTESRRGVSSSSSHDYDDLDDPISSTPPTNFSGYATAVTYEYDEGDIGDGYLTKRVETNTVDSSHAVDRYTEHHYHRTYRGHLRGIERRHFDGTSTADATPYEAYDVDWRGNRVAAAIYSSEPSWSSFADDYNAWVNDSNGATGRYDLSVISFDKLNRRYKSKQYPGTQSTKHFLRDYYYDRESRLVAEEDKYGVSTEYAYDAVGRRYQERIVTELQATKYSGEEFQYSAPAPAPSIADMPGSGDDGLIEFMHYVFDEEGNRIEEHTFELNHTDSNGIDIDATDSYVRSSVFHWYDSSNRIEASADYGSGDTSAGAGEWKYTAIPTRPSTAPTASSDTKLVTLYSYDSDTGRLASFEDPGDVLSEVYYDDLGRRTYLVENASDFSDTTPSGMGGGVDHDEDRATGFEYNGLDQITKLTAYNASSSTGDQVTDYWYEDDYNASLPTHTSYPDSSSTPSSGSDLVTVAYHLDGTIDTHTDQRGVVITYEYDDSRRSILQSASSLPTSVDDTVEAIGRTFDDYGRVEKITSYDGATTATTVLNEIKYTYDTDHARLTKTEQDHDNAVTGGEPSTRYEYDDSASSNVFNDGLRLTDTLTPEVTNSKTQFYYDSGSTINDRLHRVLYHKLFDGNLRAGTKNHTVRFLYTGVGRMSRLYSDSGSAGAHMSLNYYSGTPGEYDGWDRFGRIIRQQWKQSSTEKDRFDYVYDYAGNRTARNLPGDSSQDQDYTYDGLHRLKSVDVDTTTNTADDRYWTLDQLGNWEALHHNTDGSGSADQTRVFDDANELESVSGGPLGSSYVGHDKAGNLNFYGGQGGDQLRYDAWNRLALVEYENAAEEMIPRASFEYDGLHRRIVRTDMKETISTSDDTDTHFYYNENWQVLTETDGTNATAIYSYNPDYVDSVAVRMTSSHHANGESEHFFTHDALYNVTSAVDASSDTVVERYAYSPYGEATVLEANYADDPDGDSDLFNEYLYTGRRLDSTTELQINRYRYYHAAMGRWLNRDPNAYLGKYGRESGWGIEPNLYAYIGGRPTYSLDPSGQWFGFDDVVTGPVDEILVFSACYGAFTAWYCRDEIEDAAGEAICRVRGSLEELEDREMPGGPHSNQGETHLPPEPAPPNDPPPVYAPHPKPIPPVRPIPPILPQCFTCFVEGTMISMADESEKAIEDVEIGDVVLSYDFDNKAIVHKTVCMVDNPTRSNIVDITLCNKRTVSSTTDHPYWVDGKGWCSIDPEMTLSKYRIFRSNNINVSELEPGDSLLMLDPYAGNTASPQVSHIEVCSITRRPDAPTSLRNFRVGKYSTELSVAKRLLSDARASGDYTAYFEEFHRMQSYESNPNNHTFFANGVLVHNK